MPKELPKECLDKNYEDIDLEFKDEIDEIANLCPNTKCWEVDYSSIPSSSIELSDGKVITKDFYGEERLVWEGTKYLDNLMNFASENLRIQYDNGRITGEKYAEVYMNVMNTVLSVGTQLYTQVEALKLESAKAQKQAELADLQKLKSKYELMNIRLQQEALKEQVRTGRVQRDVAIQEITKSKMQVESIREQIRLYERQRVGFDDNMMIKLMQAQMDSFSMIFSSGMLDDSTLPEPINKAELLDVYKWYKDTAKQVKAYLVDGRVCPNESKIKV